MTADTDLYRLLSNLIRFGTVAEVDCATQRVRIRVGHNLTTWRPWLTPRAGSAQTWWPPSEGEQVILLSPEGDFNQAVALPALYSNQGAAPSTNPAQHCTHYADGALIDYDSATHTLTAILPGGSHATVKADQITADAPTTTCTGDLIVKHNLIVGQNASVSGLSSLNGGLAVLPGADGAPARIQGQLSVSDDVLVDGISATRHKHGGVLRGNDESDGPR